jgi:DMSO reductase family type II enzyme chaperone
VSVERLVLDSAPHGGPEAERAAARSRVYLLFGLATEFPDEELRTLIGRGDLARALRTTLERIAPALASETDWSALSAAGAGDELAIEHTRLFEVGASGPPCPLYGGLYEGARMKSMEEAVRYYNHFGLGLAEEPRELPDHLSTELEFLHFLAYREAEALAAGGDAGAWRRAQRDFVARHPGRWIPRLLPRLAKASAGAYHAAVFALLARWLSHDAHDLERTAGAAPRSEDA